MTGGSRVEWGLPVFITLLSLASIVAIGALILSDMERLRVKARRTDRTQACQAEFLREIIDGEREELDPTMIYRYCFFSSRSEKTDREY